MENYIIATICAIVTVALTITLFIFKRKVGDKSLYMCWILPIIFWAVSTVVWIWRAINGL